MASSRLLGDLGPWLVAAAVAVSLPGSVFLTLAGGFLFGAPLGTLLAVTGATIAAPALRATRRARRTNR
jgi:uncharacterized membrane protein YdjX (TVP38/TMEM64 family)